MAGYELANPVAGYREDAERVPKLVREAVFARLRDMTHFVVSGVIIEPRSSRNNQVAGKRHGILGREIGNALSEEPETPGGPSQQTAGIRHNSDIVVIWNGHIGSSAE